MLQDSLALMPLWAFVAALGVTLVAGFVKGAVGFAMPLIMISGLSLVMDPLVAVAGVILPAAFSNLLQAMRFGPEEVRNTLREYWRYILIVCIAIVIVAQFVTSIAPQTFYLILGVPVVILSLIQLVGLRFHIPPARRRLAEWGVGLLAGALGGMTGTWGPPTVLYLIALETPKAKQFLVQGVVYGLGSVALLAGHIQSGVLNLTTLPFSVALLVPAFLGMQLGFRFSDRLNPEVFRRVTLIVLVIAGANLVRRGLMG
ncbi:sulfite exporter TauE/SafE family protein [Roseibacterium sp. SDUM158016]|uniref:sulfite exporter TauE/SafE family protein n=1 Tax=Roseicyclus sediminis TaxID=2980997 RepID=UPI0021D04EC1|nr:sulfite exporter TauE/SafE family protein [Roseibacterium sp. SDUM158016]MCU4655082.1 sulfite exporter TauE/SafE family protein [Roseibacterium sp. SDUM158016]